MNLVLGLVLFTASSISVWDGITNPTGGVWAGLRNIFNGQGNVSASGAPGATLTAFLTSEAAGHASAAPGAIPTPSQAGGASGNRLSIVTEAQHWLGVPYAWGGNTRKGIDCSGLVQQVYRAHGINLPRVAAAQAAKGTRVKVAEAQPADLVFFGVPAHHVGIYMGGGTLLHAPHPGTVVRTESVASVAASMPGSPVAYRNVVGNAAPAGGALNA